MTYPYEPILIKVKSQVVINKTPTTTLTWLQRKACQFLDIEPSTKYRIEVKVVTEQPCGARLNDVGMDAVGNMWIIKDITENIIKVNSLTTVISDGIIGDIMVTGSMFSEGQKSKRG